MSYRSFNYPVAPVDLRQRPIDGVNKRKRATGALPVAKRIAPVAL